MNVQEATTLEEIKNHTKVLNLIIIHKTEIISELRKKSLRIIMTNNV